MGTRHDEGPGEGAADRRRAGGRRRADPDPPGPALDPPAISALQRLAGNRAVERSLATRIQRWPGLDDLGDLIGRGLDWFGGGGSGKTAGAASGKGPAAGGGQGAFAPPYVPVGPIVDGGNTGAPGAGFAPPYMPVGPVVDGGNTGAPGAGFAPPYVPVGPVVMGDNIGVPGALLSGGAPAAQSETDESAEDG